MNFLFNFRFDVTKTPVRRVDSGPARREMRFDSNNGVVIGAPRPTPATNVEIVFVNSGIEQPLPGTMRNQYNQQYNPETLPQRRDIICRSVGDDYNANYQPVIGGYQNVLFSGQSSLPTQPHPPQQQQFPNEFLTKTTTIASSPKGKAAALLGTITETSSKHKKEQQQSHDAALLSKTKRTKSTLREEMTSGHPYFASQSSIIKVPPKVETDTLRRRNSDPANKIPLLEVNRGNDLYQSSTNINIGGHRFRKVTRINKTERCASCDESDSFVSEGHRCLDCKILVHTKCIQNGGIKNIKCGAKRSKRVKKTSEKSLSEKMSSSAALTPNSKFSATREYTDSTDKIISDAKELQLMQDFITQKICKMENDSAEKVSEVDRVFKQALREFKDNLVAQYSVAHKQNSDSLNIKYRDLIANFEQVIETACGQKDNFPKTMGVNAFRGFMNEFMNSRETEKPKAKRKKDKKRKADEHFAYNGKDSSRKDLKDQIY